MEGKMETYQILRQIEYLRTSIDNLGREVMWFVPVSTMSHGDKIVKDESIEGLFMEQRRRIDGLAEILHDYTKDKVK
jgi:hypothetical protein